MSNVKEYGAIGDGVTDDTEAIRHCVSMGDGSLTFPRGDYAISSTIEIQLDETGRVGIDGSNGTAKIVMKGEGPAIRVIGTHGGTGDPTSAQPNVWANQRMVTLRNIEITGEHEAADGVELIETMQSTFDGVLIRQVHNGIRLHKRNRNVLISDSHIYHNTGVGVYLDEENLHQINISGNHISYNRRGGIRIEGSEIRNLQITGNDIEYNNFRVFGAEPEAVAEIYIDTTAERASVNEVTIASNTIQATVSEGGSNIRIIEERNASRPPGLWAISGNIIGSQQNNVHLTGCYGVTISGNCIYSGENRNLLLNDCQQISITGNVFRRHTPRMNCGVRLEKSKECVISGCTIHDESEDGQASGASLLEILDCSRITITGCQLLNGVPYGLHVQSSSKVNFTGCIVDEDRLPDPSRRSIRFEGNGERNQIADSTIGSPMDISGDSDVKVFNTIDTSGG